MLVEVENLTVVFLPFRCNRDGFPLLMLQAVASIHFEFATTMWG